MKNYSYKIIFFLGLILWIAETALFGWNDKPVNDYERILDTLSWIFILWGILGDLLSNLKIEKNETNNINTKNVNINGKPVIKFNEDKK